MDPQDQANPDNSGNNLVDNNSAGSTPTSPKPAAASEPAAPLETEVHQFTPASTQTPIVEPTAVSTPPTQPQSPSEPASNFNAVPEQSQPTTSPVAPNIAPTQEAPQATVSPPAEPMVAAPVTPPPTETQNVVPTTEPIPDQSSPATETLPDAPVEPAEETPEMVAPPTTSQVGSFEQPAQTQELNQQSPPLQTPTAPKKSKVGLIIMIVILVFAVAGAVYYYLTYMRNGTSTSVTDESVEIIDENTPTPEEAGTMSSGDISKDYEAAVAISATSDKAKVVDIVLAPIFTKTFTNVKLTDATNMLTYVTNRAITAADVASVKSQLQTLGYQIVDSTANQLTVSKTGSTWVLSFTADSPSQAEIEVTY